ncbi:MAG: hypothetical protein K0Q90_938 [Paenibacillaceae bacterium]|jgi:hypothetical protein|nr:hypothetical protein [Paenibacillaceae bacterium]
MTVIGYLKKDTEFDYVIVNKCSVTVFVEGELDYVGPLKGYSRDLIQVPGGDQYLRNLVQVSMS